MSYNGEGKCIMEPQGYMCVTCDLRYKFPHFSMGYCQKCNEQTQRCEYKYCMKCSGELLLCVECGGEPTIKESDLITIDEKIADLKAPKKEYVSDDPFIAKLLAEASKNPFEEEYRKIDIKILENKRKLIDIKDKNELMSHLRC